MLGFGPFSSAPISALPSSGSVYAVSLSETITLTTSAASGNLIDTRMAWGIGGWGSSWWGSGPSLYDTLTLTDNSVTTPPVFAALSETITLSTSVVSTATYNKAVSETVTLTATQVGGLQKTAALSASITLTDSITSLAPPYIRSLSESISLSTSVSNRGTFNVQVSEPLTLTVSTSSAGRNNVYLSDTITLTATAVSRPLWEIINDSQTANWTIIPTYKV